MIGWPGRTLTVKLAVLFALATVGTFLAVGGYLYRSLAIQLELHDDHELIGKIEQYRHILRQSESSESIQQDQHRFIDAAAGHDGLIVILSDAAGRTLLRTGTNASAPLPKVPVVDEEDTPNRDALTSWMYDNGRSARAVTAWGLTGRTKERIRVTVARVTSDRMALLADYQREVLSATLAGAALAATLGYIVVRRALRPVKRIAKHASSITAQRLDTRLDAESAPAELQALVESFNAVLDRLQESFQRLSQFSADLAHDLRTPLYNLTMQTQVALSQPRTGDEYQGLLASCLEEYERLGRMVESMLFLARVDNAQVALNKTQLDARQELERIADYFECLAEESDVQIRIAGSALLAADPALFRRAVHNLVANAIRHADQGSNVELEAGQEDGNVVIGISNAGPDIAPQHLARLFDRFYRVDLARTQPSGAAGLGLAIVSSIMKLHGGRAEVSSRRHRTTFQLIFPM